MRYEVISSGVPEDVRSMIIDADSDMDAAFRAGILIGKGLRRRVKLGQDWHGLSGARIESVFPTGKPMLHRQDQNFRREETPA